MSKLFDKYEELKNTDSSTIYIFECGNFYIALDSDAIILNEIFGFKLTKFSNLCDKCGFPKNSLEKYKSIFENKKLKYQIIEQSEKSNEEIVKSIRDLLSNCCIESLSKEDSINLLKVINDLI